MRHSTLRPILLLAFVSACARSDATRSSTEKPAESTASAEGTIAPGLPLSDTISERADRGRIMGDTATLWVVMASDFQCPYCKMWHDQFFGPVMQEYAAKNRIRLAFWNFPVAGHQNALPAAEAAMCASVQRKFWPMHESLFATQGRWEKMSNPTPLFDSLATATGVDMALYRTCTTKHLTLPLIEADRDRGRAAGVQATPTFFVGTAADLYKEPLPGAEHDLRGPIEAALAKARGAKKPAN
jgi:protein-disulfide isomerase